MRGIKAEDIRAARAYLRWSQGDLARHACISIGTVRNLEMGNISPRRSTNDNICQVFDNAGLEFVDPEGVRRKQNGITLLQGTDSCDKFFHDLFQTVSDGDGEVLAVFPSEHRLLQSFGVTRAINAKRLEQLQHTANVKCFLKEPFAPETLSSPFQFRTFLGHNANPSNYFIYGNKHVIVQQRGDGFLRFIVTESVDHAQAERNHFHALWNKAAPTPSGHAPMNSPNA
jgi:transcriptional regulator with XRE-family HTH domain